MSPIRLHDTMAREKRAFEPQDPSRITMYVCGPTVYNRAHIGNARPAVVFDVLARLLRHTYGADALVYARNFTDVDDKIIEAARVQGVAPEVVTKRYEDFYVADMGALGVAPPTIAPRATEHVGEMIGMIARLIETGHAYAAEGHVLFHVPSDPDYGALGRRDRDAILAGARVEVAAYKKDAADFVLWKPSPQGVIGWDSPWGRGRPGWHIECSAMIEKHLGQTIDIHGGGLDLIFPHHENEVAQSRCAHGGTPLAQYWLHNGFLSMAGGDKMSKSLGNVVTVGELLEAGHRGEVLRLALLSAHYRQPLDWSDDLILREESRLSRWYRAYEAVLSRGSWDETEFPPHDTVVRVLSDDINTPATIATLGSLLDLAFNLRAPSLLVDDSPLLESLRRGIAGAKLLGLLRCTPEEWFRGEGDSRIDALVEARTEAKKRRDFAEADRIRAALAAEGIVLEDGPQGTSWRRG
jgi:cysteinyl-tRNA synthetase